MSLLDALANQGEPYLAATTALVVMITLAGISIGIGKALANKKLILWGKEELLQAIVNSALLGGLFLLLTTLNIALTDIVPANSLTCLVYDKTTIIGFSQCYLHNLYLNISELASMLFAINSIISFLSHLTFNFIISFMPFNSLAPILDILSKILELLYFLLLSIYLQINLLYAIDAIMLPTILPLGLILRCFFITRKLGAVLMAIAIGTYVIYPLTYIFDFQLIKQVNEHIANSKSELDVFTSNFVYILSININDAGEAQKLAEQLTSSKFYDAANNLTKTITTLQADLILQILILPTFNIGITMLAIRELASILGAEVTFNKFDII